jgi:hypothetical protein
MSSDFKQLLGLQCECVCVCLICSQVLCVTFVHIFCCCVSTIPQFYSLQFPDFGAALLLYITSKFYDSLQFLDLKARLCSCVFKRSKSFVCFNFLVEVSF